MMVSAEKYWEAARNEYYRCDIVSVNLKEARYKIKYIRDFWETIPVRWRPQLTIDNAYSIGFHNGRKLSEINSIAASSGVRGGKKDIFVDESAVVPNYRDIYLAAVPAGARDRGKFAQVFTPLGQSGMAWEIHTNQKTADGRHPYENFSRHEFGWWDVSAFCTDIDLATERWKNDYIEDYNRMPELVEEFATDNFKGIADALTNEQFLQEFCCCFVDETAAFFTWELINNITKPDEDQGDHKEYLEQWTSRQKGAYEVFIGIDFAEGKQGGDSTSIQVVERKENGHLRLRKSFDLNFRTGMVGIDKHVDFISNEIIPKFDPDRVRIDSTSIGIYARNVLEERHGSLIEPVTFSLQSKEEMVQNLKACLESERLWLPQDNKELLAQIHGMKRVLSQSGNWIYNGDKHDDMFWALALACKNLGRSPFRILGFANTMNEDSSLWQIR